MPGCRDEVVAHLLLLATLLLGRVACALELGVLEHVVGAHPVQDELGLVGHAHDVVLSGGTFLLGYSDNGYCDKLIIVTGILATIEVQNGNFIL